MTGPKPDLIAEYEQGLIAEYERTHPKGGHGFASPSAPSATPVPERSLTPEDIAAIRDRAETQGLSDLGTTLIQGATYNFGDEIGLTKQEDVDRIARDYPVAGTVGQVAGAVLNPLSRVGMGGGLLKAIASGGAQGALAGAGIDEENRGRGAAVGGLLGAGGTAAVGTLAKAPKVIGSLAQRKLVNMLARALGIPSGAIRAAGRMAGSAADDVSATVPRIVDDVIDPNVGGAGYSPPPRAGGMGNAPGPQVRAQTPELLIEHTVDPNIGSGAYSPPRVGGMGNQPPVRSPSELVDRLPAAMQTGRGGPGRVAPPATVSPAAAVDALPPELQTSRGLDRPLNAAAIARQTGADVVPAGPYQRAAPATRMLSAPQGPDPMAAAMLDDPAALKSQIDLLRMLGQEPDPRMVERLARLLSERQGGTAETVSRYLLGPQ